MEEYRFYALVSRMRYITRWGLMRNTFSENIQEHSHMVAVLAHGLALIRKEIFGLPADPERCATAALFHDASEILTGDLPTPIKYFGSACTESCPWLIDDTKESVGATEFYAIYKELLVQLRIRNALQALQSRFGRKPHVPGSRPTSGRETTARPRPTASTSRRS